MKILPLLFMALLPVINFAQNGIPDYRSPEEVAPGRVIFRYHAPAAQSVSVQGLRGRPPVPMVKTENGVWETEVSDLATDIYGYSFLVDGATALDPRNREFKRWIRTENAVAVINGETPLWALQAVPHGRVTRHLYTSPVAGREDAYIVYTPPGYDDARGPYPVVVLCHGFGDDEGAWTESGRAHLIADNLIATGKMVPAIIVMTHGHPLPIPTQSSPDYFERNLAAMEKRVLEEILPAVENQYAVRKDAAGRAMIGLSMGGGHALGVGLRHPETFQWIGALSSAIPSGEWKDRFAAALPNDNKPAVQLLWIAIGKDDFLFNYNVSFQSWLRTEQVRHEWVVTEGGHEWTLWRQYLGDFLQKTFR